MMFATVLEAIHFLCSDPRVTKVEICHTIELMTATTRGAISALKSETQDAISALQTTTAQHGSPLADLERSATRSPKLQSEKCVY